MNAPADEEVIDIWEDFRDRVGHPDRDPPTESDETAEDFRQRLTLQSRQLRLRR